MTIAAFLDQEDDKDLQKVEELTPSAYKGLANILAIDKAEQSIIDSVTEVDDDEDEDEAGELAEEQEMKTLFESLYEIDPETKEPFVKGSAYDLKKWDEDMVCFAFGNPEHVVAMEAACVTDPFILSPEEEHFVRYYDGINSYLLNLRQLLNTHRDALTGGTINRKFAEDFKEIMGYPIPNIRMESFTREPTVTNYKIAMEEITGQQAALMAGGALVGLGIIYKLIQWFAKALNRNGAATSSISGNIAEFRDRKERRRNIGNELKVNKESLSSEIEKLEQLAAQTGENKALAKAINEIQTNLAQRISAASGDEEVTVELNDVIAIERIVWNDTARGQMNLLLRAIASSKIDDNFWSNFNKLIPAATAYQNTLASYVEKVGTDRKVDDAELQKTLNFSSVLSLTNNLQLHKLLGFGNDAAVAYDTQSNNWSDAGSRLQTLITKLTEHNEEFDPAINLDNIAENLSKIDVEVFNNLGDSYIRDLGQHGEKLKALSEEGFKEDKKDAEANKSNAVDKDKLRQAISTLVSAYRIVSSIIRFAIAVRNCIGVLAVSANNTMDKTSWLDGVANAIGGAKKGVTDSVNSAKRAFNKASGETP